jgi:hypothetical protein
MERRKKSQLAFTAEVWTTNPQYTKAPSHSTEYGQSLAVAPGCRFLTLPIEIQIIIYKKVLASSPPITLFLIEKWRMQQTIYRLSYVPNTSRDQQLGRSYIKLCLSTCTQIYHETRDLLYSSIGLDARGGAELASTFHLRYPVFASQLMQLVSLVISTMKKRLRECSVYSLNWRS